jgi:predicted DNA-binding protein with PD1-like motif
VPTRSDDQGIAFLRARCGRRGIIAAMTPSPHDSPVFQVLPLRLRPGDDLRRALESIVAQRGLKAAFVLAGIGSLRPACVRLAGAEAALAIDGDLELLTLSGTIAANGSHLHLSVADAGGRVIGGHAAEGCIVRTTAEVLLATLPDWDFSREPDPATGWSELVARHLG